MPPWLCEKGCKREDGSGKPLRHYRKSDCPFETKGSAAQASTPGTLPTASTNSSPNSSPSSSIPTTSSKPTPKSASGGLNFTGGTANTEKGPGSPSTTPEQQDFIVDKPHTKTAVNLGYRALHLGCDLFDDWLNAGVEPAPVKHIPAEFFKLSDAENQAIDFEERSIFTRGVTWACKRAGAKTAETAHHMIDSLSVAASVVTIGWTIINHYRAAFKVAPRFEKQRAANRAKQLARQQAGAPVPNLGPDPFLSTTMPVGMVAVST